MSQVGFTSISQQDQKMRRHQNATNVAAGHPVQQESPPDYPNAEAGRYLLGVKAKEYEN